MEYVKSWLTLLETRCRHWFFMIHCRLQGALEELIPQREVASFKVLSGVSTAVYLHLVVVGRGDWWPNIRKQGITEQPTAPPYTPVCVRDEQLTTEHKVQRYALLSEMRFEAMQYQDYNA